jgi:dihydrofolate reductase
MGHSIVMGRKTFASIGHLLPGRTTVIVSANPDYVVPGAVMARSWDEVWEQVRQDEQPFIVGGATIYHQALPWCHSVYLTRVHAEIEGDTFFHLPEDQWVLISAERNRADARNEFDYTFEIYRRREETDAKPWVKGD